VAPIYYWTGFSIRRTRRRRFSSDHNFLRSRDRHNGTARFLGGVQVGADWQFAPNWCSALKASIAGSAAMSAPVFPGGFAYTNNQRGLGSVTGRVGYTWGRGWSTSRALRLFDNNETVTLGGVGIPFFAPAAMIATATPSARLEYMFAPNWSAVAEYQYYNFGDSRFTSPGALVPFGKFTTTITW